MTKAKEREVLVPHTSAQLYSQLAHIVSVGLYEDTPLLTTTHHIVELWAKLCIRVCHQNFSKTNRVIGAIPYKFMWHCSFYTTFWPARKVSFQVFILFLTGIFFFYYHYFWEKNYIYIYIYLFIYV